jgi:hypothetical protein
VLHLVLAADRIHQCRLPCAINRIDVGGVLQENIRDFAVPAIRGEVERSHALEKTTPRYDAAIKCSYTERILTAASTSSFWAFTSSPLSM